jgi:outer membrane protein assembly factor BamB
MDITDNTQESKKIKDILGWQYKAFFSIFILFFPMTFLSIHIFNGSAKYGIAFLSIPIIFIGLSSIKNRVSIIRTKIQNKHSQGKKAALLGLLVLAWGVFIFLVFVFFTPSPELIFRLASFGFINPPQKYDALPIYIHTDESSQTYTFIPNPSFAEKRTFTDITSGGSSMSVPFAINDQSIFFIGYIGDNDTAFNNTLISADVSTGKINWQTTISSNFVCLDSKNIYAEAPTGYLESAVGIAAYDVSTGSEVWKTTFDYNNVSWIDYLALTPQSLLSVSASKNDNGEFYWIDPKNGKVQNTFKNQEMNTLFMVNDGTFYTWDGEYVAAKGRINWKSQVFDKNYVRPSIDTSAPNVWNNLILVKSGYGSYSPITALRENDGSVAWKFDQYVVSNVAVDGSTSYFVTENAQLVAINTETGNVLGRMDFNPKFAKDFDYTNTSIFIAAHNQNIAVYFENTKQISIVHFSPQ